MISRPFCVRILCALAAITIAAGASAQFPATRLSTLYPNGVQVGQKVEITITGGDDLEEIDALLFSHPGLTAAPKLNDQGKPVDRVFVVTAAPDVPPGLYECYIRGLWGVSNPRRFAVGLRPEVNEVEPNNDVAKPQAATLNQLVNGRMDGGTDLDWYSLVLNAGQRVIFDCASTRIDSRMDPVLELYDATGRRRLAHARTATGADPLLVFDVPVDGEYRLRIHDLTFRNGAEYFYRLDIHTGPHLLAAWPPVGQAGQTQKIALTGYNLPGGQRIDAPGILPQPERVEVDVAFPGDAAMLQTPEVAKPVSSSTDSFLYRWASPAGPSNALSLGITTSPVVAEVEPNNAAPGQAVPVPVEIAGQFATRGDVDVYTIDVKAMEVLFLEVYGERLGTSIDPYFTIDRVDVSADGKETLQRISASDDDITAGLPNIFDTRTDDAAVKLTSSGDAKFRVTVRDRYGVSRGSSDLIYRLAIRKEQPDFRLVAVPAAPTPTAAWPVTLRKGDQFAINVLALRRDDFTGPIDVTAVDLPEGVTATPTQIGEGKPSSLLVLTAAENSAEPWQKIRIVGKAGVEDPALARAVVANKVLVAEAEKAVPPLQKVVTDQTPKRDQAQQAFNQAEEAAKAKPDDQGLAKQRDDLKAKLDQEMAALTQAQANLDAGLKKVADLKGAGTAAEQARAGSVKAVERNARYGVIQFTGQNNQPAVSRVAESLPVGVMKEVAPIQMSLDAPVFNVAQGHQVLVPFRLLRRNGFEEKVTGAIQNLPPNANIEAAQINFEKGQAEQLARFFVKDNTPPGSYAFWFTSSTPVSYRRNPAKADRLKADFDAVTASAKTAQETAQKATQAKNDAVTKANQATENVKKLQAEKDAAVKAFQDEQKKVELAKATLATAEKAAVDTVAAVTAADAVLAEAKKALEANAADEGLKQKVQAAEQELQKAKDLAAKLETDKQAAAKAVADAETVAKQADEKQKATDVALTKGNEENTVAQQAKTAAEQAEQQAQNQAKAMEEARKAAEKASNDQANASKPNNVNFITTTQPILINVKAAPLKLGANVQNGGNLQRGQMVEVKVTVNRQNGFAGPVKLSLPLPPNAKGLSAAEVEVPADKNEGALMIQAAGDATEGQVANLVIRATADFNGATEVEAPFQLKVNP
jgi:hypothetical protein